MQILDQFEYLSTHLEPTFGTMVYITLLMSVNLTCAILEQVSKYEKDAVCFENNHDIKLNDIIHLEANNSLDSKR